VSSLSFEIIRIQKTAYARSLSNRSKTCYDSKGSEAKAYIRKYLRVARAFEKEGIFTAILELNFLAIGHYTTIIFPAVAI
jgi:hypothetical protein